MIHQPNEHKKGQVNKSEEYSIHLISILEVYKVLKCMKIKERNHKKMYLK